MSLTKNKLIFSIITINYNNLSGLIKTVESVFNQSFIDYEFLVIDGDSTDGSKEYLEKYSSFFSYWVSERDKGVYHAMNKGLTKATGEFSFFLNSGDYFFDHGVLAQVNKHINPTIDLAYGLIQWEWIKTLWNPRSGLQSFEMVFQSLIPHQAAFFKTSVIQILGGYDESYKVISDWGLMLSMIDQGFKTQKMDLIISTCEAQGISRKYEALAKKERFQFLIRYSKWLFIKGCLFSIKQNIFKIS
jgi:glycosyltransferase involved in cell wall biosynthesis